MATSPSKLYSDLELKDDVVEERIKRKKTATRRESKAAKKRKGNRVSSPSSKPAAVTKDGKRERNGRRSRSKGASSKQSIKRVREQRRIQQSNDVKKAAEEEARKLARKSDLALDHHPGNIIAAALGVDEETADAPEDFFWEVEAVVGRRVRRGRTEYLIRWKGCSEDDNTWEPADNLCNTAMEEAAKYGRKQKLKEKQREEDEKKLFGAPDRVKYDCAGGKRSGDVSTLGASDTIGVSNANDTAFKNDVSLAIEGNEENTVIDDNIWKWSDADQVIFREVERVDVKDPNSAQTVKEARVNGTPLVLVGHVGWANFAKRWLTKKKVEPRKSEGDLDRGSEDKRKGEESQCGHSSSKQGTPKKKAGSRPIEGNQENVVSVGTSVQASNKEIMAEGDFTEEDKQKECVSINGNKTPRDGSLSNDLLDLSKDRYELNVKKMIKDIGDEDVPVIKRSYNEEKPIHGEIAAAKFLTTCWPTSEASPLIPDKASKNQRNSTNLYLHQWQFPLSDTAGRKLCHQNNPLPKGIMGVDLLKYWLDLPQCKLDSPLQYIFMGREDTLSKLHKDPGGLEISIAPIVGQKECVLVHRADGSNCLYHLTASLEDADLQRHPLLSQARTWRTIIHPGEILLMPYGTYHQCRNVTPCLSYSRFHLDTVNLLPFVQSLVNGDAPEIDHEEVLWNLTSELINRVDGVFDEVQTRVKAGLGEGDIITDDVIEAVDTLRTLRHFVREVARREEIRKVVKGSCQIFEGTKHLEEHNFGMLVDDIDMSLHEFRFRQSKVVPPFKPRRGKALKNTLSGASGGRKDVIRRDMSKFGFGSKPVVAFNSSLENNYMSMVNADVDKHFPNASTDMVGDTLIGELVPGDKISVKLEQKYVKAEVIEILPRMKSAYLSFEDYPSLYDEYQPFELIRLPNGAEIPPEDIKPGLVVIDLSNSNEYRAKIQSTLDGAMARVKIIVSQHEMTRLVSPAMILGRYVSRKRKATKMPATKCAKEEAVALCVRPSKVGQFVEVSRRGAARVTQVYGEPDPTHVDVTYILGSIHSESAVPIEMVRLAPELDPESGRGRRKAATKNGTSINEKPNDATESKKNLAMAGGLISPSSADMSED